MQAPTPLATAGLSLHRPVLSWHLAAPRYWSGWLFMAVLALTAWLPLAIVRPLGAGLGALMRLANAKRRAIVRVNLAMCFPSLSADDREQLLQRHYRASGQAYFDLGLLAFGARSRIRRLVKIRGLEHYQAPLRAGQPVILIVPHTIGMNFTGALVAAEHPMFGMIKPIANPLFDWMLYRGRTRFGCLLVRREGGLRPVVRAISDHSTFYYLPDEDHGPRNSVFAPFFGVLAATLTTPGRLARLTGAALVPCFTRLLPDGYELRFEPALADFPSGDEVADAARLNGVLERGIREMPEQYMWTFKLFKTRPGGAPSPYAR